MTILSRKSPSTEAARFALLVDMFEETLKTLKEQTEIQRNFINVISNFFAIEKKLRIEEARRKEMEELERTSTEFDWKF